MESVTEFNTTALDTYLQEQRWPAGLRNTFIENLQKVPQRFFICDDSGSMSTTDGHKLVKDNAGRESLEPCSRWAEMTNALHFHATASHIAEAPSEFRFLNRDQPFRVGYSDGSSFTNYNTLTQVFTEQPLGLTPLCKHIREVIETIQPHEEVLRKERKQVAVVLFTDGESSDGDLVEAMKPLKDLPVWIVVRLCTDSERTVQYWNDIDQQLEVSLDVLDDLCGEAEEVHTANRWLTYCEPLHRLREFGIPVREFDILDSARLTNEQIWKFVALM